MELLVQLSRRCMSTNMRLENLLAEHKAAAPAVKRKPNMETYVHAAVLSTVLKDHTSRGLPSPCVETRAELVRASVPIRAAVCGKANVRAHSDRQRTRDDMFWRNIKHSEWQRANPGSTQVVRLLCVATTLLHGMCYDHHSHFELCPHPTPPHHPPHHQADRAEHIRRLAAQWSAMSPIERNAAVCGVRRPHHGDVSHQPSGDPQSFAPPPISGTWSSGDDTHPVSATALERLIGVDRGVVAVTRVLRASTRRSLISTRSGDLPRDSTTTHKCCCSELHPGLCITADKAFDARFVGMVDCSPICNHVYPHTHLICRPRPPPPN